MHSSRHFKTRLVRAAFVAGTMVLVGCSASHRQGGAGGNPPSDSGVNDGANRVDAGTQGRDAAGGASSDSGGALPRTPGSGSSPDAGSAGSPTPPAGGACSGGEVACPAGCADLSTDVNNCGSCEFSCPAGSSSTVATCVAGQCGSACTDPTKTLCPGDTSCEDLSVGVPWLEDSTPTFNDCGQCGNVCPVGGSCTTATCESGTCGTMPDPTQEGDGCSPSSETQGFCHQGSCTTAQAWCVPAGEVGNASIHFSLVTASTSSTPVADCGCSNGQLQSSNGVINCSACFTGSFELYGEMAVAVCVQ